MKTLRRLLCRLGWHRWRYESVWITEKIPELEIRCDRCGIYYLDV